MRDIQRALLIAVGLAVFLPLLTVAAFEAGPFGMAFVGLLSVLAIFVVVYSGMTEESPDEST